MKNYIEFLRGQMSQEEESPFKKSLTSDANLRLYAFIVTYLLRKKCGKCLAHSFFICTFASTLRESLEPVLK